jgi:hypothetical protein
VAGAAIYLVLPKLIAVLGAWPRLSTLNPIWFTVCLAAELVSFTCNFALQRLALRTKDWFPVVTAGLTGNAVTNSLPGASAASTKTCLMGIRLQRRRPQSHRTEAAFDGCGIVSS